MPITALGQSWFYVFLPKRSVPGVPSLLLVVLKPKATPGLAVADTPVSPSQPFNPKLPSACLKTQREGGLYITLNLGPEPEHREVSNLFLFIQQSLLTAQHLLLKGSGPGLFLSQRICWWGRRHGPPQLLSSEEEKGRWDGPYCYTKKHGSSDDPPDCLISVVYPASTAKSRQ